ncbi:tyrosine-type recombinase/integrase [Streptomyces sp. NPDC005356]|uniref:tyrosine-type recombinase/integrase n=1 Tax=Streptomyces sp. NPDC005356 TaxID=3157167 RepID=UPI0033A5B9AD
MRDPALVEVTGPLAPFADGFRIRLELLGYAREPQVVHLRLMTHLSCWLGERGLDGSALTAPLVAGFVADRRAGGHRTARSARSLRPLLEYLREASAAPQPVREKPADAVEVVLAEYASHLARERGLAAVTIERSTDLVRPFVRARVIGRRVDLETLQCADVTAFMLARSRASSAATVQRTGTALRSFLRFVHLRGMTGSSLVGAVPTAANWKLSGLPKYLTWKQVDLLLASCDRATGIGQRDAAILTLLARLGLRASEVAALRLEDLGWQRGEITVRGKGNRYERLPLPVDVGEVLVAYLKSARLGADGVREVFVGTRAPHHPMTRGAVTQLVARASSRCGLGTIYAHRLRHSAATGMLHAGASLEEIGQVLRHRNALTTAGYAKVDHEGLRALARPWPGEAA